jgi:hypothetical protein
MKIDNRNSSCKTYGFIQLYSAIQFFEIMQPIENVNGIYKGFTVLSQLLEKLDKIELLV